MKAGQMFPVIKKSARKGYENGPEDQFFLAAVAAGWNPTKRGWPDFIIRRGKRVAYVEVKPDGKMAKAHQTAVLLELADLGAECYVWTPSGGFRRVGLRAPFRMAKQRQRAALTNDRPDRQDQLDPEEPLAQDGSQSPEATPTTERRHLAGVHPGRIARHTGAG